MSAWHTPDDPRELSEPPIELPCDTPGCTGVVRIAAEDYDEDERTNTRMCCGCLLRALAASCPMDTATDWDGGDLFF